MSEIKQDRYEKEIYWVPRAGDRFATCFTVILSSLEVEEPTTWHVNAEQHKYPAQLIWHAKLPNRMVWLLTHEEPMPEGAMEAIRQQCHQIFKSAAGDAAYAMLEDRRAWLYPPHTNGARCFIDIALPS